jgi:hypothetical protein
MTECFELVYYGGGGFSWSEVWNMPVSHRRFNLKKINQHLDRVQQMRDEQSNKITDKTDISKVKLPDFVKPPAEETAFVSKIKSKK